jgi:hypothetical protein
MDASEKSRSAASAMNWSLIRVRIGAELGRDKKKAAILGVLILVGAVLGFRALVKVSPASASAASLVASPSVAPASSSQGAAARQLGGAASRDAVSRETQRVAYIKGLNYDFERDLFAVNPDYFPPPPKPLAAGPRVVLGNDPDAEQVQRLVEKEAKTLALQSTMVGATPIAIINGPPDSDGKKGPRVLRVGETINGFQVTQISSRSCSLKKNDMTILLEMKSDQSDK